jgi:putative transposase
MAIRESTIRVRHKYPLTIDAWVLLPDHFHVIWTLPESDSNFPLRIRLLKRYVTISCKSRIHRDQLNSPSRNNKGELTLWQRRFWEHRIRDAQDFKKHMDYIHYNPVKHGLCRSPGDWPHSTLHRLVKQGTYPEKWAGHAESEVPGKPEFGEV